MSEGAARETGARVRQALIILLAAAFAGAAAFLLTLTFHGAFRFIWPVHSPVNAEGIAAVSFLLLTLFVVRGPQIVAHEIKRSEIVLAGAIALATALAFLPTIAVPLLHDSYTHVYEALHESWSQVLDTFAPRGGAFLRPLGYVSYYLDGKWAGADPLHWHASNLLVHVANTCLVYWLIRRLSGEWSAAVIAALVFGIHGARPEAVSWVAARYDLLAAFFVLVALAAVDVYAKTSGRWWYVLIVVSGVCGVLSKESAYALPLLAALMAPFKTGSARRRTLYAAVVIVVAYGIALVYRLRVLGDVGGYREAAGQTAVLQFNPVHSVKALFLREWAFLLFPINWSAEVGTVVKLAIVLMLLLAIGLLLWSRANRKWIAVAMLWVIAAALPVQHLLLLGPDLAGARVLYLPVLGLALLFGLLVAGVPAGARRWAMAGGVVLFQFVALLHNQQIWSEVAQLSQQTCRAAGEEVARNQERIAFRDLPPTRDGIFFLANGFPYCVEMNSKVKADQVHVIGGEDAAPKGARVLEWNDEAAKFVESSAK